MNEVSVLHGVCVYSARANSSGLIGASIEALNHKAKHSCVEMDPNLLLLIMMIIVLYFFTKICLAVIIAGQQRVQGAGEIQRLEDITRQVENQTINRRAENRVRPQPQENNEWNI